MSVNRDPEQDPEEERNRMTIRFTAACNELDQVVEDGQARAWMIKYLIKKIEVAYQDLVLAHCNYALGQDVEGRAHQQFMRIQDNLTRVTLEKGRNRLNEMKIVKLERNTLRVAQKLLDTELWMLPITSNRMTAGEHKTAERKVDEVWTMIDEFNTLFKELISS